MVPRFVACAALWMAAALLSPTGAAQVQTTNAFPGLTFSLVTDIQAPPDGTNRLFVVEQGGTIKVFPNDPATTSADTFLDLSGVVSCCGEDGLLGLAFAPDYATSGFFYVNYTPPSPLRTVVSRFRVSPTDPNAADPASEQIILEVNQPQGNHNGGQIQFGPDGYLYIALGDGGGGGDPGENGEDPTTLLGSVLRIDVSGAGGKQGRGAAPDCGAGANANYTIPADNPLNDGAGDVCDEIWAYGFRNPWRMSFGGGHLWVADVGEGDREEISWADAGLNYGWNTMEGTLCYDPPSNCDQTGRELPVWDYNRDFTTGGRSITGGYVYNGLGCGELTGKYLYGDFITTNIWAMEFDGSGVVSNTLLIQGSGLSVSTFGVDQSGEVYIADYGGTTTLHRFDNCTPLPVELVRFEAATDGDAVALAWATASETNNAGFEVQTRTASGAPQDAEWRVLGFVEGAGTTLEPQQYAYRAEGVAPGPHAFRLKQIDFDGTFEYSPEVEVQVEVAGAYSLSSAHPNPFQTATRFTLTLAKAQAVRVEVYDVLGRLVTVLQDGPLEGGIPHVFTLEAGTLPSGLYAYHVSGETFAVTKPVVLVH
ncbi:MAG: PQQ-dependent sugar dehydrogenase [Rhodothermales bacterium]|nr:PQQ-dependent sugar dehydrogenase [Rhodothermales bacterium]